MPLTLTTTVPTLMSIAHASAPDLSPPSTDLNKKKRKRHHETKDRKRRKKGTSQSETVGATGDPPSKKKKDKTVANPSAGLDVDPSSHASTAALLSTIVAAAAGTPDPTSQMAISHDIINQDPQHYINYPPVQYGFTPNPQFAQPMSLSFSDLTFGSNEDVLRALQDIDISKIAHVLKTLEDAATAANVPLMPLPPVSSRPAPLGQMPAPSNAIIANASTDPNQGSSRCRTEMQQTTPNHAHLLAHKWLNASKLAGLVESEGLVYKKGKFSTTEDQHLKAAIESFRETKGLSEEQLLEIIFPKNEKNKDNDFWSGITTAVPQRPIIAVYHHVRRIYHPLKLQGKWTSDEDARLRQAVSDLGQQWEKVSERVGRMSSDCRDRYRNHIVNRDIRVTGHWTKEEEEQLIKIVTRMTVEQGKDIDNEVFWGRVSDEMGGKRGRQQCRIKWTDALSKTVKNDGQKPRWSQQDAYILIHKIDSLDLNDDTEIDWKTLPDSAWNLWSPHTLQRRWLTMKRGLPHYETMSHHEIVDTLKSKKAAFPALPLVTVRKRKERKVTSAAAITEADSQRDNSLGSTGDNGTQMGRHEDDRAGHGYCSSDS